MPTYDTAEVTTDPTVIRERFTQLCAMQAEAIAGRSEYGPAYETQAEARAAARRGQTVRELHGLAMYFLSPPSSMTRFTVEVEHTDRTRTPAGTFTTFTSRVDVLADNGTDATLVAAQMVAAIRDGGMVTATRIVAVWGSR